MPTIQDVPLHSVPVVEPEAALDEVIARMQADPLHTVALVGDEQYLGIFNEDALTDSALIPPDADKSLLAVGPYVHPVRVIAHPASDVAEILAAMIRRGLEVAPVVENRTFRGVVTRTDLEKAVG
ncbi:MAG: CBS domain-containing protein [Cytophagales bacterium]|nr:CBS domain-containing protein [Armatimonadota bacterium]